MEESGSPSGQELSCRVDKTTWKLRSYPSHWCNGSFSWNGWRISITMNMCHGPRREMFVSKCVCWGDWKFDRHLAMILRCGDKERVLWARRRPWVSTFRTHGSWPVFSQAHDGLLLPLLPVQGQVGPWFNLATSMKISRENQFTDHQFLVLGVVGFLRSATFPIGKWSTCAADFCRTQEIGDFHRFLLPSEYILEVNGWKAFFYIKPSEP